MDEATIPRESQDGPVPEPGIKSDEELVERLEQLVRLYKSHRSLFAGAAQTEATAVRLIRAGGPLCEKITRNLSEIEEYTGVAEVRVLVHEMQIQRRRRMARRS